MKKPRAREADVDRARPLDRQKAHEIQAFGHLTRLPNALSQKAASQSVENLNQILADTITLRHTARSREGFARGALKAAQWIVGRKGFFEFSDVLFGG